MTEAPTAIRLDKTNAEAWAYQGLILERRGDNTRASRSYGEAARLDPNLKAAKDGLARTKGA